MDEDVIPPGYHRTKRWVRRMRRNLERHYSERDTDCPDDITHADLDRAERELEAP